MELIGNFNNLVIITSRTIKIDCRSCWTSDISCSVISPCCFCLLGFQRNDWLENKFQILLVLLKFDTTSAGWVCNSNNQFDVSLLLETKRYMKRTEEQKYANQKFINRYNQSVNISVLQCGGASLMCLLCLSFSAVVVLGFEMLMLAKEPCWVAEVHLVDRAHCCHCVSVVEGVNVSAWKANEVGWFVLDSAKRLTQQLIWGNQVLWIPPTVQRWAGCVDWLC